MAAGDLITRNYAEFRGVDFSNKEVSLVRSPDSLNMWKDYKNNLGKCIETRPDIELIETYDNSVFGQFFYKVGNTKMKIVHSGTKLYRVDNNGKTELFTGMKPAKSNAFVYNNILYIKDGINYLKYDGETCNQVVGFIPTTSIARKPAGGGTTYQDVNMLSAYRKNTFLGDGKSTEYYLDAQNIDGEAPTVLVNGDVMKYGDDFDYDLATGKVTFTTAPSEPLTVGQDNVVITYKKTVNGYADRINKCTLLQVFDNRVFFSGNQDYPNTVWHSSLNDPTYCSDLDYYNEGLDTAPVRSMVAGNNALWVFKEPSQANTTVFYHNPTIDAEYGKIYPSTHSSISTGCVATGINFNDDIVFFSERGMEAINGDITTEQVVAHRSSLIDRRLLNETNYKNMILEEWEGYLLVIVDNHIYLADSRAMFTNENHNEYEWFYWELPFNITSTRVDEGVLYLGSENGVYKFGVTDTYKEVTFTEKDGEYVLYGESTQDGTPTPENAVEIVNIYKAGKYQTTINGTTYRFILNDDLKGTGSVKDKLYISDNKVYLTKNVEVLVLDGGEKWLTWFNIDNDNIGFYSYMDILGKNIEATYNSRILCDKFTEAETRLSITNGLVSGIKACGLNETGSYIAISVPKSYLDDISTATTAIESFKMWLSNNNVTINYSVLTPVETNANSVASPNSYWTTPEDEFKAPQYQKTTNKRGCVIDMTGDEVTVTVKTDNNEFEDINTYQNVKGYVVSRIKKKKWKSIQLKFSSNKPFGLISSTLEAYIGSYVKR